MFKKFQKSISSVSVAMRGPRVIQLFIFMSASLFLGESCQGQRASDCNDTVWQVPPVLIFLQRDTVYTPVLYSDFDGQLFVKSVFEDQNDILYPLIIHIDEFSTRYELPLDARDIRMAAKAIPVARFTRAFVVTPRID